MDVPSERDYQAAKKEYASWSPEQHAEPTKEMLGVVDLINAYERTQDHGA